MKNLIFFTFMSMFYCSGIQAQVQYYETDTSGIFASAIGTSTKSTGHSSFASGYFSEALGSYSTAIGRQTVSDGNSSFASGSSSQALGDYSFASGQYSEASGKYSTAIGKSTISGGTSSFASGFKSEATANYTTALGFYSFATRTGSTAFGAMVKATGQYSFAIGKGGPWQEEIYMENNIPRSLMIGFDSKFPTLFISESAESPYYDKTGKVGIGNVTSPQAKLHIRSDDEEDASLFIEPNNFSANEAVEVILGDTSHLIKVVNNEGMEFKSSTNFVFSGENTGFGVNEPKAKVHINGDLLFEHSMNGIILKSEDGNCWKGTISNSGELQFAQIDCGILTSVQNSPEEKHAQVFIYPNPTKGEITIEYAGNKKNLRVEFYTISGLLLATHKIIKGENNIKLNNIPSQTIVASVYTKKGELISTNKVVINK